MRSWLRISIATLTLTPAVLEAGGPDWKQALEDELEQGIYATSKVAALDGNRLTARGTAFVVRHPGILASPARHLGAVNTRVTSGRIEQPGGLAALFAERNTTEFRVGEIVYLTDVDVRDEMIVLEFVSGALQPVLHRGSTAHMRYKGQVEFAFPSRFLETASVSAVTQVVDAYFEPRP